MSDQPLVSIIINNFNYGRFLVEAIDSALSQTYKNIEVIVVDDGSTDNSREVIELFSDRIIAVFKENGGQGSAYNAGFSRSSGQLICNLDSDDTLLPEAIGVVVPEFVNPKVVKVQWPLTITDREGRPTGEITTKWTPPEGDLKDFVLSEGPFYDFYLTTGCVLRKSFLDVVLPMPVWDYRNGADVYLVTLAPIFGEIRNVMEPLGTYRFHGSNNYVGRKMNENRIKNFIARFEANCNVLQHFANELELKAEIERWKQKNFNYLWPTRLLQAKKDIQSIVPPSQSYIFINGNEWGEGEPVEDRKAIPFLEQNGIFSGVPVDDNEAIAAFEQIKERGVNFLGHLVDFVLVDRLL